MSTKRERERERESSIKCLQLPSVRQHLIRACMYTQLWRWKLQGAFLPWTCLYLIIEETLLYKKKERKTLWCNCFKKGDYWQMASPFLLLRILTTDKCSIIYFSLSIKEKVDTDKMFSIKILRIMLNSFLVLLQNDYKLTWKWIWLISL